MNLKEVLNDFDTRGREGHHESADPGAPRRCRISEGGGGNQRTIDLKGQSNITLPTKVRLVKAMVFPVVMYGCESWTV